MRQFIRALRTAWEDISQGKNIVHYLLILAAVAVPTAKLVDSWQGSDLFPEEWVVSLGVAILGLLLATSLGNRRLLERSVDAAATLPVRVLESWNVDQVAQALASAQRSVVILSTWVINPASLGDRIREAATHCRNELKVDVYMLDPEGPLGAERYGEIFSDTPLEARKARYRLRYDEAMADLGRKLQGLANVKLRFWAYSSMPEIKLYAIDNEEFFHSWLVADGHSTDNICLHTSLRRGGPEASWMAESLRHQIEVIQARSRPSEEVSSPMNEELSP